jgi:hypothetical protein
MRKLILIVAFFAGTAVMASAQPAQKTPEQRAAHMTKMLTKRLGLTPDQAQQVNAIYFTQATRMDSLKANKSADLRLNRLTVHTITMATQQRVIAILNDNQKQQFIALETAMKEKRQQAKQDSVGAH